MTYLTFLILFLVLPIAGLWITRRPLPSSIPPRRARWSLVLVCLIAFVYTTPWDNYLVFRGVWGYGTDRVLATIGYVPVEEYMFFLLQPILTGFFLYRLLAIFGQQPELKPSVLSRVSGGVLYIAITVLGIICLLANDSALYMGLILAWAGPVLLGLWVYGGDLFWSLRRPFLLGVALPTLYLWIADRIALGLNIWHISDTYSFDIDPLGLPIEEATFFLVTNLLVVQGTLLFLYGDVLARARSSG